jgi:protein arginine kinase
MNELQSMAARQAPWLTEEGPDRDVALSSRVRLARNVEAGSFSHITPADELCELRDGILGACHSVLQERGAQVWRMEDLEDLQRQFLVERHLVSVNFLQFVLGRGLIVGPDESEAIMLNEEDHLRVQAFSAGLSPQRALARAMELADTVGRLVPLAFDEDFGYLTACPTNVGTGMRASILLHLGGLSLSQDLDRVLHGLRRLRYTVRGFYGEGSDALGSLFQVSHSVTLGRSEDEILDELLHHTRKVISCERRARSVLLEQDRDRLEDRVWRAWALLRSCRILSTREAFELLSDVRMGTSLKILPRLDETILNTLLISVQSAHLQLARGRAMDAAERDVVRAAYVREELSRAVEGDEGR